MYRKKLKFQVEELKVLFAGERDYLLDRIKKIAEQKEAMISRNQKYSQVLEYFDALATIIEEDNLRRMQREENNLQQFLSMFTDLHKILVNLKFSKIGEKLIQIFQRKLIRCHDVFRNKLDSDIRVLLFRISRIPRTSSTQDAKLSDVLQEKSMFLEQIQGTIPLQQQVMNKMFEEEAKSLRDVHEKQDVIYKRQCQLFMDMEVYIPKIQVESTSTSRLTPRNEYTNTINSSRFPDISSSPSTSPTRKSMSGSRKVMYEYPSSPHRSSPSMKSSSPAIPRLNLSSGSLNENRTSEPMNNRREDHYETEDSNSKHNELQSGYSRRNEESQSIMTFGDEKVQYPLKKVAMGPKYNVCLQALNYMFCQMTKVERSEFSGRHELTILLSSFFEKKIKEMDIIEELTNICDDEGRRGSRTPYFLKIIDQIPFEQSMTFSIDGLIEETIDPRLRFGTRKKSKQISFRRKIIGVKKLNRMILGSRNDNNVQFVLDSFCVEQHLGKHRSLKGDPPKFLIVDLMNNRLLKRLGTTDKEEFDFCGYQYILGCVCLEDGRTMYLRSSSGSVIRIGEFESGRQVRSFYTSPERVSFVILVIKDRPKYKEVPVTSTSQPSKFYNKDDTPRRKETRTNIRPSLMNMSPSKNEKNVEIVDHQTNVQRDSKLLRLRHNGAVYGETVDVQRCVACSCCLRYISSSSASGMGNDRKYVRCPWCTITFCWMCLKNKNYCGGNEFQNCKNF